MAITSRIKSKTEAKPGVTKKASQGDIIGGKNPNTVKTKTVDRKVRAKIHREATELSDILSRSKVKKADAMDYLKGFSPQEQKDILQTLQNTLHEKPVTIIRTMSC